MRSWICLLVASLPVGLVACRSGEPAASPPSPAIADGDGWLVEVGRERGLHFQHQDGRSGRRHFVETVASGGGWIDFDGDGDLDIYLLNGAATPGSKLDRPPRNALFEQRDGQWVDVTDQAGVGDEGYGMGFCVGDIDADGRLDFLVTNYGPDRLYRNLGGGRFEEIAERAGVAGEAWGTNCAFADLDLDGDLDLYVSNYVRMSLDAPIQCRDTTSGLVGYCRPVAYDGEPDYLYWNRGDGTFQEGAMSAGIAGGTDDRGFGVVISDLTGDGAPDILVANDGTANRFYVNDGAGRFEDRALTSGLALNRDGQAESGMGLEVADIDGDGRLDVVVTNYSFESHTVYLQRSDVFFEDWTAEAGIARGSYLPVGWGLALFDLDNDTDLDLAVANGHVLDNIDEIESGIGYPQPNQLWLDLGSARFEEASVAAGSDFTRPAVSRALALGDWNDDGRLDMLITNTNGQPDLLENRLRNAGHWLGLRLVGPPTNPFAIGARVQLRRDGALIGIREARSGGSFLAQNDLRVHFGLGDSAAAVEAEIRWPDGHQQVLPIDGIDQYVIARYTR